MAVAITWSNPPWKKLVTNILQKNLEQGRKESLNLSLATIRPGLNPRPSVRTVVFRGFVGESKDNEHLGGGNSSAESSLFLVTTDALMAKVSELEQSDGTFAISWYHAGTNQQIRFSGTAHIYRQNAKLEFPESHLKRYIKADREWSWERERDRVWKAHKPIMRGSFRNPPPGSVLTDDMKKRLEPVELDGDDDGPDAREAKERFSLLVLEAMEVEILDLEPPPVSFVDVSEMFLCEGKETEVDT